MVRYPSGHKGADLKSVVSVNIRPVGSNPTRTAICRHGVMVSHHPAKVANCKGCAGSIPAVDAIKRKEKIL